MRLAIFGKIGVIYWLYFSHGFTAWNNQTRMQTCSNAIYVQMEQMCQEHNEHIAGMINGMNAKLY